MERIALDDAAKLAVAGRYAAATRSNDTAAFLALCTPDAVTWHNTDDRAEPIENTAKGMAWLHRKVADLSWTDLALLPTPTGFVSQTVMTGTAVGGPLRVHSCLIVTLNDDGRVTRIDEFIDPAQTAPLRG
jgi:ketosteroid isomerase-like protein